MSEHVLTIISECIISILNPIYKLQAVELPSKIFMLEGNTPNDGSMGPDRSKFTVPWIPWTARNPGIQESMESGQAVQSSHVIRHGTGPPNLDKLL